MSREGGEYQISAAELYRVFPANSNSYPEIDWQPLKETGERQFYRLSLRG
jgi:hypothetical protein